jgi:succinoglycan biosynthesis protein ExoA
MKPSFVIIIPALNEERYIAACLTSLVAQAEAAEGEIMVMDGGSIDRTRSIVRAIAAAHPCLRLIDNPRRTQSAAVNLAARLCDAPILLRADAHALYPPDFVACCLAALREHEATSVVVPMITKGRAGFQLAVAAAQNSRLGNGGAAHRGAAMSGFVDHGHHAAFDRSFFLQVGGYDEAFTHNEDAEFDYRAVQAGGRIWMCAEAPVTYFPRADLVALVRQYFRHGRGRARMLRRHGLWPRPRQMAPVAALCLVVAGLVLAVRHPGFVMLPLGYVVLCLVWGAIAAWPWRSPWRAASGVAAIAMHLGWACGFVAETLAALGGVPVRDDQPAMVH